MEPDIFLKKEPVIHSIPDGWPRRLKKIIYVLKKSKHYKIQTSEKKSFKFDYFRLISLTVRRKKLNLFEEWPEKRIYLKRNYS